LTSLTDRLVNLISAKDPLSFQQLQAATPSQSITGVTSYDFEQEAIRRYEAAQREGLEYDDGTGTFATVEDEEDSGVPERIAEQLDDPEQLARDLGLG
jgi:hypothetical protein